MARSVAHLQQAAPLWPPEEARCSYHYYTFGWLAGELCRRLDGGARATRAFCHVPSPFPVIW
jgi:hypothetical protein